MSLQQCVLGMFCLVAFAALPACKSQSNNKSTQKSVESANAAVPTLSPATFEPICREAFLKPGNGDILSGAQVDECRFYCRTCAGMGFHDLDAYWNEFLHINYATWTASGFLPIDKTSFAAIVELSNKIKVMNLGEQFKQIALSMSDSRKFQAAQKGMDGFLNFMCPVTMVGAIVDVNRFVKSAGYGYSDGRLLALDAKNMLCAVVYAAAACSIYFPAAAPVSKASSLACSGNQMMEKRLTCPTFGEACLTAVSAAKPVAVAESDASGTKSIDCCWCTKNNENTLLAYADPLYCEGGKGAQNPTTGYHDCGKVTVYGDSCSFAEVYTSEAGRRLCRRRKMMIKNSNDPQYIGKSIILPATPPDGTCAEWDTDP